MIQFILKGIVRDKNRSLLPIIIVALGVTLTVFLSGYLGGVFQDVIQQNARFETGHVKIMSKAYAQNKDQLPIDLALLETDKLKDELQAEYPNMRWVQRIKFGGLLDVPDDDGNSRSQGPAAVMAVSLLSENSQELDRLNIRNSIIKGTIPTKNGEVLISNDFADKLEIDIGDEITYVGGTMYGSMAFQNYTISGTVKFGNIGFDRGAVIMDISDAQQILNMENGATEILGFFNNEQYQSESAEDIVKNFNAQYEKSGDEFAPEMQSLEDQNGLGEILAYSNYMSQIIVTVLILAMSVVLWNTGLLGGLRRYKEYGIRLALGESKGSIYRKSIIEAILIGAIGSIIGTLFGLIATYYMQEVGLDISDLLNQSSMIMPSTIRAKIIPSQLYIGFIPGLVAMVLGNMLSGMGIYKRETAHLFKELEV
ncbi:putative ABC transport system permease protein [Marivirga sericea]|uniref:Putative ABC transport system permease protein n=1 Tax=Marivirga sericea TaxID=1028 RepID=A0A1X7J2T9_9BACT|nr:FtsX-like permease family protein [Marivirga sericea]SMG21785.1 putative ABC transport system permease protein [Marivirga sericea]